MEIKRVHLVSDEDLISLARVVNFTIKDIIEGEERRALSTLERLEKNINKTLEESKL